MWDAKKQKYLTVKKKKKFSQQHMEVQAEKQIEKSLKGILYFQTALELLGRREILKPAVHCSFLHLYHY